MMARNNNPLCMIPSAAMELCWITTWAVYISSSVTRSEFPIPMGLAAFFLSAGLTTALDRSKRIRWHVISRQGLGLVGTVTAVWWLSGHYWAIDLSRGWQMGLQMGIFSTRPAADAQWPIVIFLATWILLYWTAGMAWSRRLHTHRAICNRFDLGASLLFLLFIIKLLLWKRFGILVEAASGIYLLTAFFLFGLFSIGLAKNQSDSSQDDTAGNLSLNILPGFVVVILLLGLGSISFLLPYFESAAQLAYNTISPAIPPLRSWFAELLIAIFRASPDTADQLRQGVGEASKASPPVESILSQNDTFMHGAATFYGIIFLFLFSCGAWLTYRWLAASVAQRQGTHHLSLVSLIIRRIKDAIHAIIRYIRFTQRKKGVGYFYVHLIRWAKHSGLAHHSTETPMEFANRLADRFPELGHYVVLIAEHYNLCIYGGRLPSGAILAELHGARNKLRSPMLWPARIKSYIIRK